MARPSSRKKSDVALALSELRRRLQMSQQEFAERAGLAIQTIAKYESLPPRRGQALELFEKIAGDEHHLDLAMVFARAREQTGDDIKEMLKHFIPQRDLAQAILQREVHFKKRIDQVRDKDLREELLQILIDYARDWREHMRLEVEYERKQRRNA